jgi:hypothetical protein
MPHRKAFSNRKSKRTSASTAATTKPGRQSLCRERIENLSRV